MDENNRRRFFKKPILCPFCKRPIYKIKPFIPYNCKCPAIYYKHIFNEAPYPNDLSWEVMDLCNILIDGCYNNNFNSFDHLYYAVYTYPKINASKFNEISPKLNKNKKHKEYVIFMKTFKGSSRKKHILLPNYFLTIPEDVLSEYPLEVAGRWVN